MMRRNTSRTASMQQPFDRAAEDLGNSIHLEQRPGTRPAFSRIVLCRRARPYTRPLSDGVRHQYVGQCRPIPVSSTERQGAGAAGTGIVISGREALLDRLASVAGKLDGTAFAFSEHNDYVEATCPWGNRVRCHEPDAERFGRITLGIPYVEFEVPAGTAKGISAFYPEIM